MVGLIAMAMLYIRPTTYAVHSGAQGSIYFNLYWLNQDPYYSWFVYHISYHIKDYIIA